MKPDLTSFLGQTVRVIVDRPLGSVHPRHADLVYPVNYGEVPGTVSGDGQPIDAYLLGWDVPMSGAEGVATAVIVRLDDREDKLAVVPPGSHWPDEEIMKAVWFQERYFRVRLLR
ncbi:inorganic pyrophosphatase [Deinococcus sp. SDU3-2]|uniref:inorganic diphosphatase n=1 Tax=Deinococcus terrestris TaxID=2651870 RepID=A0A7X1TQZ9_9DEIO|nr:inorganic diphosphatase [Deinococcus terrestris]MPY65859.1 inorganic pyrophosphatase [Deinococcus terrestris]